MKRSSFLKSLLGIAVAPMAIAKVMETETVINPITEIPEKYKGEYGAKEFKRIWDEAGQYADAYKDEGGFWYENELKEAEEKFSSQFKEITMKDGGKFYYKPLPILFQNEKLT